MSQTRPIDEHSMHTRTCGELRFENVGEEVTLTGWVSRRRDHGGLIFCDLRDREGITQLTFDPEHSDGDAFKIAETMRPEWPIKIHGVVRARGEETTNTKLATGEIEVLTDHAEVLHTSVTPPFQIEDGIETSEDTRLRYRYLDLRRPEMMANLKLRSDFTFAIREALHNREFMEVETPVLSPIAGGANARPFITHHNTLDIDMYMRIATELHLKRLIVGGLERVYEVGRIFRNEGMDTKHNPEFTTCELYQAFTNLDGMMDILEGILAGAAKEILGTYQLQWLGHDIDLTPSWKRVTMADAVKEVTGADFMAIEGDNDAAVALAKSVGVDMDGVDKTWGNALYETFDQKVEETLIQPTFITMYPVEVSPLAKRSPSDPHLTERYEMFVCGCEMGNAFTELNDPMDQYERFKAQVEKRANGDDEAEMMDEDYVMALEYGLPPTGGLGFGIDRCAMMLCGTDSIRDVILFPTMKPQS